jgi:hypothetical protein
LLTEAQRLGLPLPSNHLLENNDGSNTHLLPLPGEYSEQAKKENCDFIWGFPRKTSWDLGIYKKAGFELCSKWIPSETSANNAYCKLVL